MSQIIWQHLENLSEEIAGFQGGIHDARHGGLFTHPLFCPEIGCAYACHLVSMIQRCHPDDIDSIGMNDNGIFTKREATERAYGIFLNYVAWAQVASMEGQRRCLFCNGEGWVCEDHPQNGWRDGLGCCGSAGAPCKCNTESPPWKHQGAKRG